jgi:hypothetical protein
MIKNKIVSGLRGYMLSYLIGMDLMIGNSILRNQIVKEQKVRNLNSYIKTDWDLFDGMQWL